MHKWGDTDKNGQDICYRVEEVSEWIGEWLRKYARINVMQYKEKFGTVRIYCGLGWTDLGDITHPGYYHRPRWALKLMCIRYLNWLIIPIQAKLYRYKYKQAIKKWPDLKNEILCCADYPEYLEGL